MGAGVAWAAPVPFFVFAVLVFLCSWFRVKPGFAWMKGFSDGFFCGFLCAGIS